MSRDEAYDIIWQFLDSEDTLTAEYIKLVQKASDLLGPSQVSKIQQEYFDYQMARDSDRPY